MIKVKDRKLLLLPGDGIGPEVVREVRKIIEWFNKNKSLDFKIEEGESNFDGQSARGKRININGKINSRKNSISNSRSNQTTSRSS